MNILHVVDFISQRTGGGAARVPWHLAKEQAKLGHTVSIYASDDNATMADAPPGVELRLFKCWFNFMGGRITPSMPLANFRKFDIIHLHNYRTVVNLMAAWQGGICSGTPYVLQALGSSRPIPVPNHWYTRPWKTVNDTIWQGMLSRASRLIACSDTEIYQYVAEGADRSKCTVMPMGIDLDDYSDVPAKRKGGHRTILYVGRFHELKGPDILVRAFSLLDMPNVRLVMVGTDDGYLETTKRIAHSLGLDGRVSFPGFVDGIAKRQLYTDADVYVLPSRYEAYGLCIQEALACGTSVIVTNRCAIAGQIPDYCSQVVECDSQAISDALRIELTRADLPILRNTRIKWARQFGWDKIARQAVELYRSILVGKEDL